MTKDNDRDAAFTTFVESRQQVLMRFGWLLSGGSHADAEDLVQEALARVYRRWREVEDPEPYARTTMVRLNISRWRKIRLEVLTPDRVDRATTDASLEAAGGDADLLRAVLALPPRQRAAVVLRFWFDLSDEQIAEAQGCASVTVRSNIHRALARMRANWQPNQSETSTPSETLMGRQS